MAEPVKVKVAVRPLASSTKPSEAPFSFTRLQAPVYFSLAAFSWESEREGSARHPGAVVAGGIAGAQAPTSTTCATPRPRSCSPRASASRTSRTYWDTARSCSNLEHVGPRP